MPSPRPSSCSLRGASAAIVGRAGRRGANGLSASGSAASSRNGLRAGMEKAGANGLAEAFGGGANGFTSRLGGSANGLLEPAAEPAVEPAVEPAADPAVEPAPAGSQLGRLAFDPRSASSQ